MHRECAKEPESLVETRHQNMKLFAEQKIMKAFDRHVDLREGKRMPQISSTHKGHLQVCQVV